MRILHIIDSVAAGGGAEESLVGMLPRLRKRGIDGHVVCLDSRPGHEQALREDGFQVDVLEKGSLLAQAWAIRRIVKRTKPDMVHASLIAACFATRLGMLGLQTPQLNSLVNTTYDPVRIASLGIARWKMAILRGVDRLTSRWVKPGFHALTQAVKDEAVEVLNINPSKVWVIPRGRDSEDMGPWTPARREQTRTSLGVEMDQVLILNVGRQEPQKAKLLLVDAFTKVSSAHPNAILCIAGKEGKDSGKLMSAVQESPAADRIRVLGQRSDVADLLVAADMFVFPSHYEGQGGALVEALCMACPAIGSDAPAIAEVLGHGEYGIVVPRGNSTALAEAMSELASSPESRAKWARKARERFQSSFELEAVMDQMAELYRRVANR